MLLEYLPIFIFLVFALIFATIMLGIGFTFGPHNPDAEKNSPYECGLAANTKGETRYSVKFYITAMLFILFDIDVVFLIPWVLTHRDLVAAGIPILGPMLFFTFILVAGLVYELKSGALEWEK